MLRLPNHGAPLWEKGAHRLSSTDIPAELLLSGTAMNRRLSGIDEFLWETYVVINRTRGTDSGGSIEQAQKPSFLLIE
ncbi:unnamed protein product [Dibothriocephalus latus]|uniref:Uncharacterized protein n=1 Tax=Dibothriocephalus latus TaxID=60516 RepID=A0A3P7LV14_DIBLA|nr:unnamed protein product [Dibothriocephalus latus]